jgi:hypothetical protein
MAAALAVQVAMIGQMKFKIRKMWLVSCYLSDFFQHFLSTAVPVLK